MAYCTECDTKLLGTGMFGSGKCAKCYALWHPAELNPVVPVAKVAAPEASEDDLRAERERLLDRLDEIGVVLGPMTSAEKQRRYRERRKAKE